MARKIKFPLEMKKGYLVRNLDDLQKNFSMEKVLSYYLNGKLQTWLKERYYDKEYSKILELDKNEPEFTIKLCEILGVVTQFDEHISIEWLEIKNKKIQDIREYTSDEYIMSNIDKVAFNQDELLTLLDGKTREVYLFGEKFEIPTSKDNVSYIGINKPTIKFDNEIDYDFDKKNIIFRNLYLTSEKKIKIKIKKSKSITLDAKKIQTRLDFKGLISTYDLTKNNQWNWYDVKVFMYKNLLINVGTFDFEIIDINTKVRLVSFADIKPTPVKAYKNQRIETAIRYKNSLVIYWGSYENTALQIFNLDTLKIEKSINIEMNVSDIDVYDNIIGLYERLNGNFLDTLAKNVICQYYDFPSLDFIKQESVFVDTEYNDSISKGTVYNGEAYKYSSVNRIIKSTNKNYLCEGFLKKGNKISDGTMQSIGLFKIVNDRIVATYSEEKFTSKKSYLSVVDIGEIGVFNISGGEPVETFKVFDNPITKILHCEDLIIAWGKDEPNIKFFDDKSYDIVNEMKLDLQLGTWDFGSCLVCDVFIDSDTQRMAVSYNGIVAIYE